MYCGGISRDDDDDDDEGTLYKVIAPPSNNAKNLFSFKQENKFFSNSNMHLRYHDDVSVDSSSPYSVIAAPTQPLTNHADNNANHCSSSHHHRRQRNGVLSQRSPHMKLLLALLVLSSCLLQSTQARQLQQHEHFFPGNDEYDPIVLDATNIYGNPFGGYSRATKSRLASRPLKLPDRLVREDDDDEDSAVATETFFWEVADGIGRRYACRIFDEDEVEPTSLNDSLFDPPAFRLAVELDEKRHNDLGTR